MFDVSAEFLVTVLISSSVAAIVLSIVLMFPARQVQPVVSPRPRPTFLFHDGQLVDASAEAEAFLPDETAENATWADVARLLIPRFPGLPIAYPDAFALAGARIGSALADDSAELALEKTGDRLRLTLKHPHTTKAAANHHAGLMHQQLLDQVAGVAADLPYPVWAEDSAGALVWTNKTYETLSRVLSKPSAAGQKEMIFQIDSAALQSEGAVRASVGEGENIRWFKITANAPGDWRVFHALDISTIVAAEKTQRGFVQTLTKTFAQLGTGLAIFDREHRLVLFNPALIDLTQLPAEFLSGRPSLSAFFDYLRESRVMPEPRNYAEWRDKLTALTKAAQEGTFSELWSLPSGLSYRVFGRPHPDGAIAFLFEDVTAELSLTRNFVKELEINYSLLDTLPAALAIYSTSGQALFANKAYVALWDTDPTADLVAATLEQSAGSWLRKCAPDGGSALIRSLAENGEVAGPATDSLTLADGQILSCQITPLAKGATAVSFAAGGRAKTAEKRGHAFA